MPNAVDKFMNPLGGPNNGFFSGGDESSVDDKWAAYDKYLAQLMNDPNYFVQGLGSEYLDQRTNQYYDQARGGLAQQMGGDMRNAGQLGSARGYSQGLSNPFALAQRAQQGVYGQYANAFGGMETDRANALSGNLLKSWQTGLSAADSRQSWAKGILGYQGQLYGLRSTENQANQDREAGGWDAIGKGLGSLALAFI
jgi:hypothetical protein